MRSRLDLSSTLTERDAAGHLAFAGGCNDHPAHPLDGDANAASEARFRCPCNFTRNYYYEQHWTGTGDRHVAMNPVRCMGRNAQIAIRVVPVRLHEACRQGAGTRSHGPGAWLDRTHSVRPASGLFS